MKNYVNTIIIVGLVIISVFVWYSVWNKFINLNNYIEKQDYIFLLSKYKKLEKNYMAVDESLVRYKKAYNKLIPPTLDQVFSINGTIKEITASKIILETANMEEKKLFWETPKLENKIILIDENTKFIKIKQFAIPKEVNGELKVLENTEISIDNLKVSDQISVFSNENIKTKMKFTAKEVSIFENNLPINNSDQLSWTILPVANTIIK